MVQRKQTGQTLYAADVARMMGISEKALRRRIEDERRTVPRPRRGRIGGRMRLHWLHKDVRAWAEVYGVRLSD